MSERIKQISDCGDGSIAILDDAGMLWGASELTAYIEGLGQENRVLADQRDVAIELNEGLKAKAALLDEWVLDAKSRCPMCRDGYAREPLKYGAMHKLPYEKAEAMGYGLYFNDKGGIYCGAREEAFVTKYDALTTPIAASKGEAK